jgi:hypothetical protein
LLGVADFILERGPSCGLFLADFESEKNDILCRVRPAAPEFALRGFGQCDDGFRRPLLGAPFGTPAFIREEVVGLLRRKMADITQLHRIQDAQLESLLLKHCFCSRPMHLLQLLHPNDMADALLEYEAVVRVEISRILGFFSHASGFPDHAWGQVRQPIRSVGFGLHNLPLVAPAAYVAAHGSVARLAGKLLSVFPALQFVLLAQTRCARLAHLVGRLAAAVNTDTHSPLCPSVAAVASMPSQKRLSNVLYKKEEARLIAAAASPEHRAWLLSCARFGSGMWLAAIPSQRVFKLCSLNYVNMARQRLFLPLLRCGAIKSCLKCPANRAVSLPLLRSGIHSHTICEHSVGIIAHNRLRDVVFAMYKYLHQPVQKEVNGLFCVGAGRPADILVQPVTHNTDQRLALDFGISCPCSAANLQAGSERKAGISADRYETTKRSKHANLAAAVSVPFEYRPIILESSGGFGTAAERWWKNMQALDASVNCPAGGESPVLAPDMFTWSAQRFTSYWLQRISLVLALTYVTHADPMLTQCDGFGADPG